MGRPLPNFDAEKWKQHAIEILPPALKAKFEQHDHMRQILLSTGDRLIGEASPSDSLFGIGFALNNPAAMNKKL